MLEKCADAVARDAGEKFIPIILGARRRGSAGDVSFWRRGRTFVVARDFIFC
jgi:hypothetical protein